MSYKSDHMNHPVGNGLIRAGMAYVKIVDLFKMDDDVLRKPDPQHYGNTKWGDHAFLYFFIKNDFEISPAAADLGTGYTNFERRLSKINAKDWLIMIYLFRKEDFVIKTTVPVKLAAKVVKKSKGRLGSKRGLTLLKVAAALKQTGGSKKKAAELLGVSVSAINYWCISIKDE